MFKYSKDGISVLLVLDTRRAKKSGLFPVKIQVVHARIQKYYSTGKDMSQEEWKSLPDSKSHRLIAIRTDIANSFSIIKRQVELLANKGDFCFEALNTRLGRCSTATINAAFESKMKDLKENNQANTYFSYRTTLKKLEDFGGKEIPFSAITVSWLNRCERFWQQGGTSYSSMSFYFRNLKCIVNIGLKDGVLKETQYPFGRGKYEVPTGSGRKLALSLEQIEKLVTYTDGTEKTEEYRDLWFFSYLCNGINFRDLLYLKYSDMVNGEICFVRAKTARNTKHGKVIHAVVTPEMQAIIHRWGNTPTDPHAYIFKYAKAEENAFDQVKRIRDVVIACNNVMKKITEKTGLPKVTTYSARHSFATVLKRSGTNISYISDSLGHSSLSITENYLAGFESDERKKNAKLLTNFTHTPLLLKEPEGL